MWLFKKKKQVAKEPTEEFKNKHFDSELISLKPAVVVDVAADELMQYIYTEEYKKYLESTVFAGNKEQESAFLTGFNFAITKLLMSKYKMNTLMMYKDYMAWREAHGMPKEEK